MFIPWSLVCLLWAAVERNPLPAQVYSVDALWSVPFESASTWGKAAKLNSGACTTPSTRGVQEQGIFQSDRDFPWFVGAVRPAKDVRDKRRTTPTDQLKMAARKREAFQSVCRGDAPPCVSTDSVLKAKIHPGEFTLLSGQRLHNHMQKILVRFRRTKAFRHRDFAWGVWGKRNFPHVSPLKRRR
jgi:hypothetical protein